MARRVLSFCLTAHRNVLKKPVSPGLLSSLLNPQSYNLQKPLLVANVSQLSSFASARSQHNQSTDTDDGGGQDEPRSNNTRRKDFRNEHESILLPVILNGEPLSKEEWNQVKNDVINMKKLANEENIDAIIMGLCIAHKKIIVGTSLLDSLKEANIVPNVATLGRYLKLCYECHAGDEETLLGICNEIRKRCPVMDSSMADSVIHGLARTSRWQEGFELLGEIRLSSLPASSSLNALAEASFNNGELKKGWDLMEQMLQMDRRPSPPVYKAWIDQCIKTKGSDASVMIGQLLDFWADHDLRPSLDVAEHLRYWFEHDKYSWEGCFTTITPRGSCENCRTVLRKRKVSDQEFDAMRKEFLGQVVVGSNVFLKTNPEELETFQQFLTRTAPYDVVIDGLNVAFSTGRLDPKNSSKTLQAAVEHFAVRKRRILVLGRRHMQNWPRREMGYIHENASVFLAQDVSQDDPFLLYAAMFSGPNTQFVSRDLMRGHVYLLKEPALRRIFRRWQQQRQVQVYRNAATGHVTVVPPLPFNPSVQQGPGAVWHIPYDNEFRHVPRQYEPPRNWLCIKKYDENETETD